MEPITIRTNEYNNIETYINNKRKGIFVALEGIEATGKTTISEMLRRRLEFKGRNVVLTREPGGTNLANDIRKCIMKHEEMNSTTELLLFMASRRENVSKVIYPALKRGDIVITDRYALSSVAYQGYGRGVPIKQITDLNEQATGQVYPDITFIIDIDTNLSMKRKSKVHDINRLDRETNIFYDKVLTGYRSQKSDIRNGEIVLIDGNLNIQQIAEIIEHEIENFDNNRITYKV